MTNTHTSPIIGLAGGIGSGKSTIASLFNKLGIESVDADDVARDAVKAGSYCLEEIIKHFGDDILLNDGNLNRRALRDIIFNHPAEKDWLESLTHPVIREEINTRLNKAQSDYVLLVHPLLFETKQNTLCQFVIAINVPSTVQTQRVIERDSTNSEQVAKILASQLTNQERLNQADLTIENNGNITELSDKVQQLHQHILDKLQFKEYIQ